MIIYSNVVQVASSVLIRSQAHNNYPDHSERASCQCLLFHYIKDVQHTACGDLLAVGRHWNSVGPHWNSKEWICEACACYGWTTGATTMSLNYVPLPLPYRTDFWWRGHATGTVHLTCPPETVVNN